MVKIQEVELLDAIRENNGNACTNWGFCLACGMQQEGYEPDARHYECEDCGKRQVFGAEEILIMGAYTADTSCTICRHQPCQCRHDNHSQ